MSWYTVTKTIKGRRYLYLQMTYRVGGKVKTKNKYLGPAHSAGASFAVGAPVELPTAEPVPKPPSRKPAAIVRASDLSPRAYAKHVKDSIRKRANDWRRADREYDRATMSPEAYRALQAQRARYRRRHHTEPVATKRRRTLAEFVNDLAPDVGHARTIDRYVAQKEKEAVATTSQASPSSDEAISSVSAAPSGDTTSDPQPGSC
jgi:hypothetical protein